MNWTDDLLWDALGSDDEFKRDAALAYVFLNSEKDAVSEVVNLGGSKDETETVFPRALGGLLRKANSKKFKRKGVSPMKTFIRIVVDEWAMEGIRKGAGNSYRDCAFIYLNDEWRKIAEQTIADYRQHPVDFEEALENASARMLRRIENPDFILDEGSLYTYFSVIVKREYWKTPSQRIDQSPILDTNILPDKDEPFDEAISVKLKNDTDEQTLKQAIQSLSENCQKILNMHYFEGAGPEQIANRMGYTGGKQVARNEKHECMKKLMDLLSPELQEKFGPKKGRPRK